MSGAAARTLAPWVATLGLLVLWEAACRLLVDEDVAVEAEPYRSGISSRVALKPPSGKPFFIIATIRSIAARRSGVSGRPR